MSELTCIVCPRGCRLTAERDEHGAWKIEGNACARGPVYAVEELTAPKRTVSATCRLGAASACREADRPESGPAPSGAPRSLSSLRRRGLCEPRRLPVRSSKPCPRELVPELLAEIYRYEAIPPVRRGQVLIGNWRDTGIDVVATRTLD